MKTAAGPDKLIDKGLAGPGLLAHVAVSKDEDHLPLNRLGEIYVRGGVELAPFLPFDTGSGPHSVAMGDLNGDGKLDLVAANSYSNTVSVLLGSGDGTFGAKIDYSTGGSPNSVAISDLNSDGRLDLAVANNGSNSVSVLLGYGDGTFTTKVDYGTSIQLRWTQLSWDAAFRQMMSCGSGRSCLHELRRSSSSKRARNTAVTS